MSSETRKLAHEIVERVFASKPIWLGDALIRAFEDALDAEIRKREELHAQQLAAISTQAGSNTLTTVDAPLTCVKELQTQALFDVHVAVRREIALQAIVAELRGRIRALQNPSCDVPQPKSEVTKQHDPVNHQAHCTSDPSGVECIEITRHRNFNVGNAIKYLWRAGLKDSTKLIEDLKKSIFYINDEIGRLERQSTEQPVPLEKHCPLCGAPPNKPCGCAAFPAIAKANKHE